MKDLSEEKLRKQIREMLLNSDEMENFDLKQKKNFQELKKDSYDKLIDLKNDFESQKEKPAADAIEKINKLIVSLKFLKNTLTKQL